MDNLVRKTEIQLAKKMIEEAGLYIANKKDISRLADVATDAYASYPLHVWVTGGEFDADASV